MGSYDNIVKIEEIRRKKEEGDLPAAQKILDTMEIKKVKNLSDLNLMAEVYSENERYDEAAELYLKIYEKLRTRRTIFKLVDISIKRVNVEEAEKYFAQYRKAAPEDFDCYVFQYKIDKMKGVSYEQLIKTVEALNQFEYTEKWAYELAKLYYKAGMESECIRECSEIALWFGEGVYVEKAKMLRSYFSGEADKDKIMEELKRKYEQAYNNLLQENVGTMQDETVSGEEPTNDLEEDIISGSDFMVGNEEEELVCGLKRDVEDILTNETEDEFSKATESGYPSNEDTVPSELQSDQLSYDYPEESQSNQAADDYTEEEINEQEVISNIENGLQINLKEIFGDLLHAEGIREQLIYNLNNILLDDSDSVFLLITGREESDKAALAKNMALFISKAGKIKSSKVAKISAGKMNTIDLEAKKDTLKSCCLVIEKAAELKSDTADRLLELTRNLNGDIAVILEEDINNIGIMSEEYPQLMELLKNQIHLPQ